MAGDNPTVTEAPDKQAGQTSDSGLVSQAYQWLSDKFSSKDAGTGTSQQADATQALVQDKTLPSLDLGDAGKSSAATVDVTSKPGAQNDANKEAPKDTTSETAKPGDASKDKDAGKPEAKFDSSQEFLKAHPEMKMMSHKEEAHVHKQVEELQKSIAEKQTMQDNLNHLAEKAVKFNNDLKSIGVPDLNDIDNLKQKLAAQPPEVRQKIQSEYQELRAHAEDFKHMKDAPAMEKELQAEKVKLGHLEDKLALKNDLAAIDKLPQAQRDAVYQSMDRILDRHDKSQTTNLSEKDRQEIVKDLTHQIAHPEDIKQGNKGTCALASTEFVLAKERPDAYAKAIESLATKGELSGAKLSKADLHGDDGDPERSKASKLFQTAAANLAVMDSGARYENFKPGEAPAVTAGKAPSDDSGERLVTKDGKIEDWPGLKTQEQVDVLKKITGENFQVDKLYAWSADSFQKQLEEEAKNYGYPVKIGFYYPDGSAHAVSITGIDNTTHPATVKYDDTAQPRGESQQKSINDIYGLAVDGPNVQQTAFGKIMILGSSVGGSRTDPYVEVIRPPKK